IPASDGKPPIPIGRLKKRTSFLRVRKGNAWRSGALVLQARRRPSGCGTEKNAARFGFTATRRLGPAVIRNRARRRLKETVRLAAPARARPGYDYVVIARQGALTRSFAQLQNDLCRALDQVHNDQSARA
ncbi:MAG: ribonuclease P protein component, partial [Methyloligellaceae bacterium]